MLEHACTLIRAARIAAVLTVMAAIAAIFPRPEAAHAAVVPARPAVPPALPEDGHMVLLAAAESHAAARAGQAPGIYLIRAGDPLSGISGRFCGTAGDYPSLAAANHIPDADLIYAGRDILLACHAAVAAVAAAAAPAADPAGKVWGVTYGYPNYCGDGDGDGWDVSCGSRQAPAYQAPAPQPHQVATAGYSGGSSPGGSFGQCVVARESGGNAQVMNATGHYGLYQFAARTWAADGGEPGGVGHGPRA